MTEERAYQYNGYRLVVAAVEVDGGFEGTAAVFDSGQAMRRGDVPVYSSRSTKKSTADDAIKAAELLAQTWVDGLGARG